MPGALGAVPCRAVPVRRWRCRGHGRPAERGSPRRAPHRPPLRAEPPPPLTMAPPGLPRSEPRAGCAAGTGAPCAGWAAGPASAGRVPTFSGNCLTLFSLLPPSLFFFPPLFLSFSATWACSPQEGVVQPGWGGRKAGRWEEGEPGMADGSPACREAQGDPPPAGTARGNAAGAPGGVTGGRPRGWPRPAGRHWGRRARLGPHPAPRAAPRPHRGQSFDSALAARSPGPPSTWGRFYACAPTLLPSLCLPAASPAPRRVSPGRPSIPAAPPRPAPRGEAAPAGAASGGQERAPCARSALPAGFETDPSSDRGRARSRRAPVAVGSRRVSAARAHGGGRAGGAGAPRGGGPARQRGGSRLLVAGIYTDMLFVHRDAAHPDCFELRVFPHSFFGRLF
ncbi:translation initiation factor IF-2-like isoform X1 [Manacus candei]|uniref:translation initiation factor IF-2-like isoform X1 n=1 Tax=Manacus candei TaxID=415023 RepID=UPI0022275766|nr:translation initiation factor IF-2-like isoform X1 [Manacus candei]